MNRLKQAIEKIAAVVEPNAERAKKLSTPEKMETWREVFTDPAVAYRSYEPYEFIGDKKLNELIAARAIILHPEATEEQLTNLVNYYGANKTVLAPIMEKYMIPTRVKSKDKEVIVKRNIVKGFMFLPDKKVGAQLTSAIYADMFEAILGGIYLIGESIQKGLGDVYCRRWFEHIFVEKYPTFDERRMQGNAKQIVETLLSRFNYYIGGKNRQVIYRQRDNEADKEGVMSVSGYYEISQELKNYISTLDPKIAGEKAKNFKLYQTSDSAVTGGLADEVKEESSQKLLDWLKETCDIDVEWAERVKSYLDARAVKMEPLLRKDLVTIRRYLVSKELDENFFFEKLGKHDETGKRTGLRIVTTDREGIKRVLFTRVIDTGLAYIARKKIIEAFAADIEQNQK